jgi:uncharacterized protein (DUF302 family)
MYERDYAHTKKLGNVPPEQAIERVKAALAGEGFGVLTTIDVQATLKAKLGVDRPPYVILGACNPPIAHKALEIDLGIGLLMPCNVDVFVGEDGATYVQAIRGEAMMCLVDKPAIKPIAMEIDAKLVRVLEKI